MEPIVDSLVVALSCLTTHARDIEIILKRRLEDRGIGAQEIHECVIKLTEATQDARKCLEQLRKA